MGQVTSHISGIFGQTPKQEEKCSQTNVLPIKNDKKITFNKAFFSKDSKSDRGFTLPSLSYISLATPRNPLKRTRNESPSSLPQSFIDKLYSYPKKLKVQTDEFVDYPFLNHIETINYYNKSKILILLRGLPGSGKSTIVKHLEKKYNSIKVCSADHFFMKDGKYEYNCDLIKDAHAECQKNAIAAVEDQVHIVVIDNTNLKLWEMMFYLELADEFNYVPVIVEPQTPWKKDVKILASKTTHNIPEEIMQFKHDSFDEALPLYYGWFLNEKDSFGLLEEGQVWIEEAYKIPEFRKEFQYLTKTNTVEELIDYYKKPSSGHILHITAKYIGKYLSTDNLKYMKNEVVSKSTGKAFQIEVVGFVLTPRTLGARVRLSTHQFPLWDKDDDEEIPAEFYEVETPSNSPVVDENCAPMQETHVSAAPNGNDSLTNGDGGESVCDSEEHKGDADASLSPENTIEDACASFESTVANGTFPADTSKTAQETPLGDIVDNGVEVDIAGDIVDNGVDEVDKVDIANKSEPPKYFADSASMMSDSPPASQKFSPQKGVTHSPRKGWKSSPKKRSMPVPPNDLDIDRSLTQSTWAISPLDSPPNLTFFPTSNKGSRAHFTLGCAPGVRAVTTGLDLIMAVKEEGAVHEAQHQTPNSKPVRTHDVNGGSIRNYGNGVWVFYPEDLLVAQSVFSFVHGK